MSLKMINGNWVAEGKAMEMRGVKPINSLDEFHASKGIKIAEKKVEEIEKPAIEITTPATEEAVEVCEDCKIELTLDQLKAMCDEKGIKYHHANKEAKLKTLLGIS